MLKQRILAAGLMGCAVLLSPAVPAIADEVDYTKMTPEELAEYLILEADNPNLEQEVQEGGTARQRMVQDDVQKTCSVVGGRQPDMETLLEVSKLARETIVYPEGGIKLGDWKRGRNLAWSGYGFRIGHNVDDHDSNDIGGNCYNCHQLGTDRTGGTIGPSLVGFGRIRGTSDAIKEYTYNVIYNSHSAFPCTNMPRFGSNGFLDQQSIADIMAYLLDPESPVNQ